MILTLPRISRRPKIVLVGFLARCAKMVDGGVYAAFGSASASTTVFRWAAIRAGVRAAISSADGSAPRRLIASMVSLR